MSNVAERNQLLREMIKMGNCLRGAGIDFLIVLNTGGKKGKITVDLNAQSDRSLLDMAGEATSIMKETLRRTSKTTR